MAKTNVEMQLLGRCHVTVDGKELEIKSGGLSLPWQILCILAAAEGQWLATEKFAATIWPDSPHEQARNSLKNGVLRLRNELAAIADARGEYLVSKAAGYKLSDDVHVTGDFVDFCNALREKERLRGKPVQECLPIYRQMVALYRGPFHNNASKADWRREFAYHLDTQLLESVCECYQLLWQEKMYDEILGIYTEVENVRRPCDEMRTFWYRTQQALGRKDKVYREFPKDREGYRKRGELNNPAFAEIRDIAAWSGHDGGDVTTALRSVEAELDTKVKSPPRVMPYHELKEYCKATPARYAIAMYSFEIVGEVANKSEAMREVMSRFERISLETLRGHDIITPYSANQYLVVLPNHSVDSSSYVRERLTQLLAQEDPNVYIHTGMTSI